jgi:hypothetical protein
MWLVHRAVVAFFPARLVARTRLSRVVVKPPRT